jgi:hypothetical protein
MAQICKYDELRLKTERQLHQLIDRELEHGIREAQRGLSRESWTLAEGHYLRAQRARATALHFIRLLDRISSRERECWEAKLGKLCEMIDSLYVLAVKPSPTSEAVASLARALWEARGCPEGSPDDDWFRAERTLKSQRASHPICC